MSRGTLHSRCFNRVLSGEIGHQFYASKTGPTGQKHFMSTTAVNATFPRHKLISPLRDQILLSFGIASPGWQARDGRCKRPYRITILSVVQVKGLEPTVCSRERNVRILLSCLDSYWGTRKHPGTEEFSGTHLRRV